MPFLNKLKEKFGFSDKRVRNQELGVYLKAGRDNLKLAFDCIGKFLDGVKDFQPAIRHQELYYGEVRQRLIDIRNGMRKGFVFIDERMNNEINTQNPIKSSDQLKQMVGEWSKTINANDDKVYDILKILNVEMWSEERGKRGFPVPQSKDYLCNNLGSAVNYLKEASNSLDQYSTMMNVPEA